MENKDVLQSICSALALTEDIGALFRKQDNKHFRACSDEHLLQFINGFQPQLDT